MHRVPRRSSSFLWTWQLRKTKENGFILRYFAYILNKIRKTILPILFQANWLFKSCSTCLNWNFFSRRCPGNWPNWFSWQQSLLPSPLPSFSRLSWGRKWILKGVLRFKAFRMASRSFKFSPHKRRISSLDDLYACLDVSQLVGCQTPLRRRRFYSNRMQFAKVVVAFAIRRCSPHIPLYSLQILG